MTTHLTRFLGLAVVLTPCLTATAAQPSAAGQPFRQVNRPGSVDLEREYDLSELKIPREQIHTLLPRDAIPALTNPKIEPVKSASWLSDDARVIVVSVRGDTIGFPIRVLDYHEIINIEIGGDPVAVTYCPLCDSATVFARNQTATGEPLPGGVVLDFGVSGALYNSNVLMYDTAHKALWSQLAMGAVSGPMAGVRLRTYPFWIMTLREFRDHSPDSLLVSNETGYSRDYKRSPYDNYFSDDRLLVPVEGVGDSLPMKTLGIGVLLGESSWFVPVSIIEESLTLPTPSGDVVLRKHATGVAVVRTPADAQVSQTFYYSWSAFHPNTRIVGTTAD